MTALLAVLPDVYHAVRVGVWIDAQTGDPVYAVDIVVNIDGGPDAVVGNGPTLDAALAAAVANLTAFMEKAA